MGWPGSRLDFNRSVYMLIRFCYVSLTIVNGLVRRPLLRTSCLGYFEKKAACFTLCSCLIVMVPLYDVVTWLLAVTWHDGYWHSDTQIKSLSAQVYHLFCDMVMKNIESVKQKSQRILSQVYHLSGCSQSTVDQRTQRSVHSSSRTCRTSDVRVM